jgi:ankyrin repeat protein
MEILTICSSLITSTDSSWYSVARIADYACEDVLWQRPRQSEDTPPKEVRLAHLSVKEWLTSSTYHAIVDARVGPLLAASDLVAQTCLAYLLQFDTPRNFTKTSVDEFPFLNYAVYQWLRHLDKCLSANGAVATREMARDLLMPNQVQFQNVAFIFHEKRLDLGHYRWPTKSASSIEHLFATAVNPYRGMEFASPLYWAANFGEIRVCQLLIKEGADVSASSGYFETPLNAAIVKYHNSVVKLLISNGAEIEPKDGQRHSPLQLACEKLNLEVVKLLLYSKVDVNAVGKKPDSAIALAAYSGDNGAIIRLLLDASANVNQDDHKRSALTGACGSWRGCSNGNEVAVRLLLDHGANVNGGEDTGNTTLAAALLAAVGSGNLPAMRLLVGKGADFNTKDGVLETPLMWALRTRPDTWNTEKIIRYLIDNGADVKTQLEESEYGNALCTALAQKSGITVIRLLLDAGGDSNGEGRSGKMPLQVAIKADASAEVVALLLQYGANVNELSSHYGTALQAAASAGRDTTVALLLDWGADVNQTGGPYGTALCAAAHNGHHEVVQRLIDAGADVEIENEHGWTTDKIAWAQGYDCVLKVFSELSLKPLRLASNWGTQPDRICAADSAVGLTVYPDSLTVSSGKFKASRPCVEFRLTFDCSGRQIWSS